HCELLLAAEAVEGTYHDPRARLAGQLPGRVGRPGVDHHHLVAEGQRRKAFADPVGLVVGDHGGRDLRPLNVVHGRACGGRGRQGTLAAPAPDTADVPQPPAASVVFTTYNQPDWLEKVLVGFGAQDRTDFEVLVADDGSRAETRERIEA